MIGIDEVGRGAWAGPLLVVAIRPRNTLPVGLTDSKLLVKRRRELLASEIQKVCDVGEGWVESREIDEFGLTKAMKIAVKRALVAIKVHRNEQIIIDGTVNYCGSEYEKVSCKIKADLTEPVVSAASIIAKVKRDDVMVALSRRYPEYSFERHVGYGTKTHQESLQMFGLCPEHRMSYKPVKRYVAA